MKHGLPHGLKYLGAGQRAPDRKLCLPVWFSRFNDRRDPTPQDYISLDLFCHPD